MPTADTFLVMRYGHRDEAVTAPFATVAARLGVRLRPVLPWTEWASVDGQISIVRLRGQEQESNHAA
jgi:hypothetical protein